MLYLHSTQQVTKRSSRIGWTGRTATECFWKKKTIISISDEQFNAAASVNFVAVSKDTGLHNAELKKSNRRFLSGETRLGSAKEEMVEAKLTFWYFPIAKKIHHARP